jgi:hypothetical protein
VRAVGIHAAAALAVLATSGTVRADPTKAQCMDANEAAQVSRTAGKLRDAIAKLQTCIARSCPGPVRQDCTERLSELQKLVPTVVFEVVRAGGGDVLDASVTMDGVLLAPTLDGTSIAVDTGPHTFRFEAPGLDPFEEKLLIREGDKARHEHVVMQPQAAPGPPAGSGSPAPPTATGDGRPADRAGMRIGAYASFGAGVAGIAVGSIFGALAVGNKSGLSAHCSSGACPASEQSDINGLATNGAVSTVGFAVGVAGLAAGTMLFLLSRGHDAPADTHAFIGPGGLEGRF